MKKLVLVIALTMIALLLFAGLASAGGAKVQVCHVIEANAVVYDFELFPGAPLMDLYFGKEISVSENALETHVGHGDSSSFLGGETAAGPIATFQAAGVQLPAADCYVVVPSS
jgi:hypothetical protein